MKVKLGDGSGTADLKYLMPDRDRHGVLRIYFRKKGRPTICLKAPIGSEEFLVEYRQALSGSAVAVSSQVTAPTGRPERNPTEKGSLRWLIEDYYRRCVEFKHLDPSTRHVPRRKSNSWPCSGGRPQKRRPFTPARQVKRCSPQVLDSC